MKKLILFFAIVCSVAMLQAQTTIENVPYIDADGVEKICQSATLVPQNLGQVTLESGWYVLKDIRGGIICKGDVHIILIDGDQCKVEGESGYAGIQVFGEGNSLTIYGQAKQTGTLTVTGGDYGAGIGGGVLGPGSNITINGGIVKATGGLEAAGIGGGSHTNGSNIIINGGMVTAIGGDSGAGIGGGNRSYGFNITINGGTVTAKGETDAAGIGSGRWCSEESYNIFVATELKVIADKSVIEHASSEDIASKLAGKQNVTTIDLAPALKTIDDAVGSSTDATILEIANAAKTSILEQTTVDAATAISDLAVAKINALKEIMALIADDPNAGNTEFISGIINGIAESTTTDAVNTKKTQALNEIPVFMRGYSSGKASALGILGTKQNGPAIIVTDQDGNEIILYSPKSVEYIKVNE